MVCIFIHKRRAEYLEYVLRISRHFNPDYRLILLGDKENEDIAKKIGIEFHYISDYTEEIPYHHLSVNNEQYEKFCFERWFIVKNFVKYHEITEFIHSDSDNAICYNINMLPFKESALGNSSIIVPNVIFLKTETLNKITEFYTNIYSLPRDEFIQRIEERTHKEYVISHNTLHYSDMFFLKQSVDELNIHIIALQETHSLDENNPLIFNSNFNQYEIEYTDGMFFKKGTQNRLFNIHFAGNAKIQAKLHYNMIQQ